MISVGRRRAQTADDLRVGGGSTGQHSGGRTILLCRSGTDQDSRCTGLRFDPARDQLARRHRTGPCTGSPMSVRPRFLPIAGREDPVEVHAASPSTGRRSLPGSRSHTT
jgi:hypothetical protein